MVTKENINDKNQHCPRESIAVYRAATATRTIVYDEGLLPMVAGAHTFIVHMYIIIPMCNNNNNNEITRLRHRLTHAYTRDDVRRVCPRAHILDNLLYYNVIIIITMYYVRMKHVCVCIRYPVHHTRDTSSPLPTRCFNCITFV